MKTLLQTLFFFLLVTQFCFAQWFQQNSGTTKNLNAVIFTDLNIGFAVGDSGTILKTTDGGGSWLIQTSGTSNALRGVSFIDLNIGTAVGDSGTILRTTNGGINWTQQNSSTDFRLNDVSIMDTNNGTAVGGHMQYWGPGIILRTTNGGTTWTQQSAIYLFGVSFTDVNNGWIVGSVYGGIGPKVLKTTDGGTMWQSTGPQSSDLYDVSFSDANNGTVVGMVSGNYRTTDGGSTWTFQPIGTEIWLTGVSFTDANNGTIIGGNKILRTTNGGLNWIEQNSGTTNALNSVFFIDSLNGWAVGEGGTILQTTNGGVSYIEEEKFDEVPIEFLLSQNYPNPFNPSTRIKYSVPQVSQVQIKVFDVLGNEIEILVNEEKPTGTYELNWYAENLPSGVYFYQLKAGDFIQTRKMVLMK